LRLCLAKAKAPRVESSAFHGTTFDRRDRA
jgi:hypothetical protein